MANATASESGTNRFFVTPVMRNDPFFVGDD
jgi:hypothetical protein